MTDHDKHRDNDDMRDPVPAEDRVGLHPDSKSDARGDAREAIGNTARGTAAHPTGPEANDKTRHRPHADAYDADLQRDNRAKVNRPDGGIRES